MPIYVEARLRQQPVADASIVSGSTPVLSFGNPMTATLATLGLNPSDMEFSDREGVVLEGDERRLETLASLNVRSLADAPIHVLQAVVDGCNGYFQSRPYRWFGRLELILNECDASYYDGKCKETACHLDLVQWATEEKWSNIWDGVRTMLLRDDVPFLIEQLRNSNIRALLLNGRTVIDEFASATGTVLTQQPAKIMGMTSIFVGRGPRNILVVGWSTNLQSSRGVSNEWCREIAGTVARILRENAESDKHAL